jgi:enoyl-CoA hydratase/carnithine racemase
MLLTGDAVDAERAERIGLLNHIAPPGQAVARATELAGRLCERAPLALRRAKEAAYRGRDQTLAEGLRTEMLLSRLLVGTADLQEGRRAFVDRRQAEWQAR